MLPYGSILSEMSNFSQYLVAVFSPIYLTFDCDYWNIILQGALRLSETSDPIIITDICPPVAPLVSANIQTYTENYLKQKSG